LFLMLGVLHTFQLRYLPAIIATGGKPPASIGTGANSGGGTNATLAPANSNADSARETQTLMNETEGGSSTQEMESNSGSDLFTQFFQEMSQKNYAEANILCRRIEELAAESGDPRKIEAAKELRETYSAIAD
jgi:hypothetical protein